MIQKKIFSNNLKINFKSTGNKVNFLFSSSDKLFLRLNLSVTLENSLYIFQNLNSNKCYSLFKLLEKKIDQLFYKHYLFFSKIYMIGLGYKNFVLSNRLYLLVGDCNYIIFEIPDTLKVFCRKNQIYVLSCNQVELFNFAANLKKIKKPNFYKGKGVLEFKNFKFTKLKVGKKQRFM